MAKPIRFAPKKIPHGWRLNIPAKISGTGKRQQLFYRTQALALAAADDLKKKVETFGIQTRAIAPTLAEQAVAADLLLRPYGITVLDAAQLVVAQRTREAASSTMQAATADWLLACAGLRDRTTGGYKQTAKRLVEALGTRTLANITPKELQAALAPLGTIGAAAAGRIRNGKAFWRWAAKKGLCEAAIFDGVEMPKDTGKDEIQILTVAEAQTLLRVAEEHFPQAAASFALQLFAGIRAEEITRLEAEHVTADGIELPASVTKKGRRRHITPNATLAAWLEKYPFAPCSNWRRVERSVRYLAGWNLAPDPDLVKPGLIDGERTRTDWPQNALRHSHASYAVATGVPLESLLFEFGHSGSPNMLRQHYVGRASKKEAIAFFAIMPTGMAAPEQIKPVEKIA